MDLRGQTLQCQRPGCEKTFVVGGRGGTAPRFCSPEHQREDYNERKAEQRAKAAKKKKARKSV